MKHKHTGISSQTLKRRVWMITIAQFLTAANCFTIYFAQNSAAVLILGIIFLLLMVVTFFSRLPERSSKGDVIGSCIVSMAFPVYLLFSEKVLGAWLLGANTIVIFVGALILFKPLHCSRKEIFKRRKH